MIHPRFGHLLRQAVTATAAAALLAASLPASALAHASFLDSNPAPSLRLETGPAQITLDFTEPLNSELSNAKLTDLSSGQRVPVGTSISGSRRMVLQPQIRLGKGVYRIDWHSVSTEDGHALDGSFGFGVQVTPTL